MIIPLILFISNAVIGSSSPLERGKDAEVFLESNIQFTENVYQELLRAAPGNFLISPFSVEEVLAVIQAGSRGDTRKEIARGLHLPEKEEDVEAAFQSVFPKLRSNDEAYNLSLANKIYLKEGLTVSPLYRKLAEQVFRVHVENLKFEEAESAASSVNQWVEQQTNNKIRNLISPQDITGLTQMLLINTLYFSGKWEKNFNNPQFTKKKVFYKNGLDKVDVDTMFVEDTFQYYECSILNAKIIELPYQGEEVSMTIVLPNERDGLKGLTKNVDHLFRTRNYTVESTRVELPKFSIEYSVDFKEILQRLGIKAAFDEADFSGLLVNEDQSANINGVLQKTFINVTEDGTEATSATAAIVTTLALVPEELQVTKYFIADHPFLFYIRSSFGILFVGHYSGP